MEGRFHGITLGIGNGPEMLEIGIKSSSRNGWNGNPRGLPPL